MKKLLLSTVALLGLNAAAGAADLATRIAPVAPIGPAPIFTWTGFYIGAQVGYGWSGIGANSGDATRLFNGGVTANDSEPADGFVGGGTIGFNYQTGTFVLGLEGDISATNVQGDFVGLGFLTNPPPFDRFDIRVSADMTWYATARMRAGVAFDRLLVYATGGLAFARFEGDFIYSNLFFPLTVSGSASNTHTGWTVGGGVEYAFTQNISAKIDSLYMQFDEQQYRDVRYDGEMFVTRAGVNFRF